MGCVDGFHFKPTHLSISLAFGLAVMLIINIFACVGGGQLNPCITLIAVIYKLVSIPVRLIGFLHWDFTISRKQFANLQTFFVYFVAQLLGGYLGYALLIAVTPSEFLNGEKFCLSLPTVEPAQAFVIEFIITMILCLVFCGVIDPRNANHHGKYFCNITD